MSRLAIVPKISDFFSSEIETISRKHGLSLEPVVVNYLAELLSKFSTTNELKLKLSPEQTTDLTPTQFWIAIQSMPLSKQYSALQFLGDYSLFTTGFFNEHIKNSILDMDYFQALGGQAYYRAGEIRESIAAERALNIFFSLAESFKNLSEVVSELYDRTLLNDSEGTLKLFGRYQESGSHRLARLLMESGVYVGKKPTE